ncbi:hypothetical protein psal_cds_257 [Pandoravirus salinus]|uniref:RING-type domain-containing protein n=1 Tax=Pandoravirus salinus TaxID=1349410 RepID=A0A291ATH4_9VIRU|nr:hypothetical protein psal_cds_257 [Pandoravirus salinus]ATE82144.1 hypothetical protein psal_cds_257 [Pandoravirus salinus]
MTATRIVYNLTGRPLRTRRWAGAHVHPAVPLWPVALPALYELDERAADETPSRAAGADQMEGPVAGTAGDWQDVVCCIGCGVHLGDANARQYCAKTHCPFAPSPEREPSCVASDAHGTSSVSSPAATSTTATDATSVGVARVQCAYPIALVLRSDASVGEALWMRGSPARPVIHLGEQVFLDFDAVAAAMRALAPGADRRRTSPRRAPAARNLLDARVSVAKNESDEPVVATVPLATLLDSAVEQDRAGARALCVARSAVWVGQALAQRRHPPSRPQRSTEQARSDMERMMRRLDRIVSRVASDSARGRTGHVSDDDGGDDDDGDGNDGVDADSSQTPHAETVDVAMDDDDNAIEIVVRAPVPTTRGRRGPVPAPAEIGGSRETVSTPRRRIAKRPRPEATTTTTVPTARPRPAKRTRKSRAVNTPESPEPPRTAPPADKTDDHTSSDAKHTVPTAVCDIVLRPCTQAPGIECSICMRDDGTVLWDVPQARPATLHDLWTDPDRHVLVPDGARLPDNAILVNPCRNADHAVCVGCMRAVLLNRGRPPVSVARAAVGCVSLDGESRCAATAYPEAHPFALVLDGGEAAHLAGLYDRHRFPGMEVIACPLHVVIDRPVPAGRRRGPRIEVLPCGAECIVEHDRVARAVRGHLAVACTQNLRCAGTFCYHCRSRLPTGAARCARCTHVAEHNNPEGVNRYFYRPGLMASTGPADKIGPVTLQQSGAGNDVHLLRNREITQEVAVDQIERVLAMDRVAQPCYRCGVPLLKSTECNALSHCGVQKCYMCGRNALAGGHLEPEHWDAHGATGCPRYDHHAYWRTMKDPFVCAEGRCYNDASECKVAAHRAGIEAMHAERRVWHAWGMLRSLAAPLRECVISKLVADTPPTDTARGLLLARVSKILLGVRAVGATTTTSTTTTTTTTTTDTTRQSTMRS